jgi:hypothetical protein
MVGQIEETKEYINTQLNESRFEIIPNYIIIVRIKN